MKANFSIVDAQVYGKICAMQKSQQKLGGKKSAPIIAILSGSYAKILP
jgi:hypothetical protein